MSERSLSAVERIALARTREEVAQGIEPLAQAMAALADDLRRAMDETKEHAQDLSATTARTWTDAASKMEAAARALTEAAQSGRNAAETLKPRLLGAVILAALLSSAAAPTAYWLWQSRSFESAAQEKAARWDRFTEQYARLSEKDQRIVAKLINGEK